MHKQVVTIVCAILLLGAYQAPPMPTVGASRTAQPPDGITVRGSGTASAQASTATLTLDVTTKNNAIELNASSLQPIVDALVRAGVQQSDIRLPIYLTGNNRTNNASIVATVHHPTVTMLENGIASQMPRVSRSSSDCVWARYWPSTRRERKPTPRGDAVGDTRLVRTKILSSPHPTITSP